MLGLDVSAWQGNIAQATWNNFRTLHDMQFAFIRSSRGGTTGYYNQSDASNANGLNTLSQRYDDPYFVQNITRATAAGILTGSYHFARPDIIASTQNSGGIANSGTDEANHFLQMAGAWMRPGYLLPVFDLEAGQSQRTANQLAQFSIDFSDRIYEVMGIRPMMYINGNYANYVQGASVALRTELVQKYPTLWVARYPNQDNPSAIPIQTMHPNQSYSPMYGPWDDAPNPTHPWSFWQYASTGRLSSFNNGNSNLDFNVAQGGIEFVKDKLVPAIWMNDSDGNWSTLANWNSGQTPVAPVQGPGQVARVGALTLPAVRLPGVDDTIILDRTAADIAVTLSSGSHNIRKLFARETLNITGGSLNINYVPSADSTPISAQFSSAVTLSGTSSLSVHTLQVDLARTFTVNGGTLAFNKINLMPHSAVPARILIGGNVNVNPLSNAAATISNGAGSGASGIVDLGGANRTFNVGNGSAAVDVTIAVPVTNGGLTKTGAGTLALTGANTYMGETTIEQGTLSLNSAMLANGADVRLFTDATLNLNFSGVDVINAFFIDGASQSVGTWGAVGSSAQFTTPLITGSGLLQVSKYLAAADFNLDGFVDAADLDVWRSGVSTGGTTPGEGDANGDFVVDGNDFLVWQRQFTGSGPSPVASVPEPAAIHLLLVAASFLGISRSRQITGSRGCR